MPNTRKDTQNTHRSPHQATTSTPRKIEANAWVRTADAIHIITATRLEQTDFVTYDRVQARGAEAMGFVVRSPGHEDGWWR